MRRELEYKITESDLKGHSEPVTIAKYLSSKGYSSHILTYLRHSNDTVILNNASVLLKSTLIPGDCLHIVLDEKSDNKVLPVVYEGEPFEIIFEDEDILVINKPAGMPIHPSRGSYENTLGNAIAHYYLTKGDSMVFRCINRLDKNTSGLTVIAKNMLSAALLYEQMVARKISRTYTAIVENTTNTFFVGETGTINAPIEREGSDSIKRCVEFEHGKEAITHYRVIKANSEIALIQLNLDTGRTHQIRVHMSYIGHPLCGDNIYNPNYEKSIIKRHALHAGRLEFDHPLTEERLVFQTDLPQDISTCVQNANML